MNKALMVENHTPAKNREPLSGLFDGLKISIQSNDPAIRSTGPENFFRMPTLSQGTV
jgi:hypothetical protein